VFSCSLSHFGRVIVFGVEDNSTPLMILSLQVLHAEEGTSLRPHLWSRRWRPCWRAHSSRQVPICLAFDSLCFRHRRAIRKSRLNVVSGRADQACCFGAALDGEFRATAQQGDL